MDLSAELGRPGLDRRTRLLALAKGAIWPADWQRLRDVVDCARRQAVRRADLEETLLQATLFFGFPRTVTAFEHLAHAWPAASAPVGGEVPPGDRRDRGYALFAAIYADNDEAVRARLRSFHAEFHDFVLEAAYGRVLARPGLDALTRELLAVTALLALDQVPQLVAHARGALHFGADREAVAEAMRCAGVTDEHVIAMLRRV